jgi:hypothetical protein
MEPIIEQRRSKKKKWAPPLNTNQLQMAEQLKARRLGGLILGSAVWLCVDAEVVHVFDCMCIGNLDGGVGTAAHVRQRLEATGRTVEGNMSVRLSVEEAFFMAYALGNLTVFDEQDGKAVELECEVSSNSCAMVMSLTWGRQRL